VRIGVPAKWQAARCPSRLRERGGATDLLLMGVIDAILTFPALILAIAIVAVLGPGLRNAMIAIGIVQLPVYARLMRAQVLTLKGLDWLALGPGLAISVAVFAFNWLGDALRDALDPRLRQ
jgi:ABC-type dipeptide/oligopeptide/nickel transport system permease subunit